MKCFTVSGDGNLKLGIVTSQDTKLGTIVFLGEDGRGRHYQKVGLFRKSPAVVSEKGMILDAHPIKITPDPTKPEKFFYVLAKPEKEDKRVLVRINTGVVYTRGASGHWDTKAGEPLTLIKGYGAHGLAGRTASWDDGLLVMKIGDVVKVIPDGGSKTGVHALFFKENDLTIMQWDDYEALTAVESATNGEGGITWM